MYRDRLKSMQRWFESSKRKPLVLRGARQVGKSTLVRMFAEAQQLELIELNLERNPEHAELFDSNNPQQIVATLRLLLNKDIKASHSILFLDEIQAAPSVLAALRYFYEEMPEQHVVAAGSLLDFELASPSFSMPVGRISTLHIYPLSFCEFLLAVNEPQLAEFLQHWQIGDELPGPLHHKLMGLLRQNIAVGSMPEAVDAFAQRADYRQCETIKQDLLATFADDFAKYTRHQDRELIRLAFRKAPAFIGRKVKYSEISSHSTASSVARSLTQLHLARVIHKVIRCSANGVPLAAEENRKFFKLLFLDVGLVSTMFHVSWQVLQDELMLINQGALAEQWVGQELLCSLDAHESPYLNYWAREARSSSAEIDYVVASTKPVPVEVKAGKSGSLKSLHLFLKEKHADFALRINADMPSMLEGEHALPDGHVQPYRLLSLPLYLAGQVRRLIGN